MIVGVPRERKAGERRVALLPPAVGEITALGHDVHVETRAGAGVDQGDDAYRDAGATIVTPRDAWDADLVVKVKEAQPEDFAVMPRGATIFSYHHLPGEPGRTRALAGRGASAIAFEMVRDARSRFPLLAPMSEIAGRMAIGIGTRLMGHAPARVLVLGAGHAGLQAAREARRAGAHVTVLTRSGRSRDAALGQGYEAALAAPDEVERAALAADLIVGAVFVQGEPTPKLLPRTLVRRMRAGAVIVDISIDAGGVAETSRATTHDAPTFVEEGVVHYCVANIPAADPVAAAGAICAAALPYVIDMAGAGVPAALLANPELRAGVLLWQGRVTHAGIAAEAGLPYTPLTDADLVE
jgi:alanine dehydrogenase